MMLKCQDASNASWRSPIGRFSDAGDKLPFPVYADKMQTGLPAGMTAKCSVESYTDKDGVEHQFNHTEYRLPELGSLRTYKDADLADGIVLPIKGRRYLVQVLGVIDGDAYGEGYPTAAGRRVMFTETTAPETPFGTWSEADVVAKGIASAEACIASCHKQLARLAAGEQPTPLSALTSCATMPEDFLGEEKWIREDLKDAEKHLADLRSGKARFRCTAATIAFGQPDFIQNPAFPVGKNGHAAFNLLTLNTGWGDAGNENFLATLDDDGRPEAVFHEASCC